MAMMEEKWNIYWNEYSADTYLYGTEIIWHRRNDVEFKNPMMPPGTIIKQWYSKTNFQLNRIEPSLPMIDGEGEYRITVNIDCEEAGGCLIRLLFYDKYEEEAGSLTLKDKVTDFKCPLKTYSYRVQLINGGAAAFRFHSIVIQEIRDETEEKFKTIT